MPRPRLEPRLPRGAGEWAAASVVALAVVTMLVKSAAPAAKLVTAAWPFFAALVLAGAAYAGWRSLRSSLAARARAEMLLSLRITLSQIDDMNDQEFEFALRDLLIRDGWSARQVGRQGDQAADVIGQNPQRGRIVIQAKHTKTAGKVVSQIMYQVKGTAGPVHGADIAVVVTNGTFTRDAKTGGERHQVQWVDRDRLLAWAEQGEPLHHVLRLPRRPPRRASFRRAA